MDSIDFINHYPRLLDEMGSVIDPKWKSVLEEMRNIDPHDLVTPNTWFINDSSVRGFLITIFLNKVKEYQKG